jgi:3-hydroxyisobutyrate dehydrogenase
VTVRVGFIGLGNQGAPIARRIAEAGHPTTLWARRPEVRAEFENSPASFHDSPADLAADADIISICVTNDAAVEEVMNGPAGVLAGLLPGSIVAIHSTVHPDTVRRLAASVSERGAALVDAPVSGGATAAVRGEMLVMTGGDHDAVERCRPVFETFASHIVHFGDVGDGQTVKLINNLLFTANVAAASGACELATTLGIDQQSLASALSHGSGASFALNVVTILGFSASGFSTDAAALLHKDFGHIADLAGGSAEIPPGLLLPAADALRAMTSPTRAATDEQQGAKERNR